MPDNLPIMDRLRQRPRARVRLIVRTTDDPRAHVEEIEGLGLRVHHVLRIAKAVAVEGTGARALRLAERAWVKGIEEDQEVRTQRGAGKGAAHR
ncbi:MAG: hypothetical protein GX605_00640 [Chloroflexi bacterium]|nr:hypothetical protein [Chloroflexota bacterium]